MAIESMHKLLAIFLIAAYSLFAGRLMGVVVSVADGDTVRVMDVNRKQHRVRLYGIDTPEIDQEFGRIARNALSKLVFSKNVVVDYEEKDQYGRIVGKLYVNGTYVNLVMVKAGYAWHYVRYAENEHDLAEAEEQARKQRLGIWVQDNPMPPWEFRRKKR